MATQSIIRCPRQFLLPTLLLLAFTCAALPTLTLAADPIASTEIEPREELPVAAKAYAPDTAGPGDDRFTVLGSLDAAYTLSERSGASTLSGGSIGAMIAPALTLPNDAVAIVMYNGNYYKKREFYSDQIGPRERTEYQAHTITPMLRMEFGEQNRFSATPSLFHTRSYNKDVEGGGWDDGLYNYRDSGAGLDFRAKELGFAGGAGILHLGAQYYWRKYPNYVSLLDLATGLGIEADERDYHGVLLRTGYSWGKTTGFFCNAGYYLLRKNLQDKKVVDANGVLTNRAQSDALHSVDLRLQFSPAALRQLRIGVDLNTTLNRSNQNYYDGSGTLPLADDVFLKDFYDYDAYRVRPHISFAWQDLPLTATVAYSIQETDYKGRFAQQAGGAYKDAKQEDTQEEVNAELRYALADSLNCFARWQYIKATSNNEDTEVYEYEHEVHNYSAGLSFSY